MTFTPYTGFMPDDGHDDRVCLSPSNPLSPAATLPAVVGADAAHSAQCARVAVSAAGGRPFHHSEIARG